MTNNKSDMCILISAPIDSDVPKRKSIIKLYGGNQTHHWTNSIKNAKDYTREVRMFRTNFKLNVDVYLTHFRDHIWCSFLLSSGGSYAYFLHHLINCDVNNPKLFTFDFIVLYK